MGDIADSIIDRILDDPDPDDILRRLKRLTRPVSCRVCGKTGLTWKKGRGGKWFLADSSGKRHACRVENHFKPVE